MELFCSLELCHKEKKMSYQAIYSSACEYSGLKNHLTPLIELKEFSSMLDGRARIFAKFPPHGNIKRIAAAHMFRKADEDGRLANVHTVIEASSGGMALALKKEAACRGKHFIACIRNDTALGQKLALGIHHVQLVYENDLPKGTSLIEYAKQQGEKPGFLNFCQYESPDNAEAYEQFLAPQISQQIFEKGLENSPIVFCAGVGTGGTLKGTGRGLQAQHSDCRIIAVTLAPEERVPGLRDPERLLEVKTGWEDVVYGSPIQVTNYESYLRSLEMIKMGLDVGPSSGAALAGLLYYLKNIETRGDVVAVFVCPDYYKTYADKYESFLDGDEFARIPPFGW